MSTYSTNFWNKQLPAGGTTIYTVPADAVVVVRDMELVAPQTGGDTFNIISVVSGQGVYIWYPGSLQANEWRQWQGRAVVPAGGELQVFSSAPNAYLMVSGYLLSG